MVLVEHNDVTGIFISQRDDQYYIIKAALARDAIPLIQHEEHIVNQISHCGIISFISQIDINGFPALVMHRYTRGSLINYLGLLSPQEISNIFSSLCEVSDYLYRNGIFHRDIKPDNIVLDKTGLPVLIDFGMSCFIDTREEYFTGTPEYASPEVLKGHKCTHESELYSIASVVYALIHGNPPSKDDVIRRKHGLSVQEDEKLNRMLSRKSHVKDRTKTEEEPQKVKIQTESKKSLKQYISILIALLLALWFAVTRLGR